FISMKNIKYEFYSIQLFYLILPFFMFREEHKKLTDLISQIDNLSKQEIEFFFSKLALIHCENFFY
ncbi:MAG: hypothetical protein KGD63_13935, partial [Candidatus Lokiarchaeota archaeon]|nr:hypothetical protein [Candidatus Lokiarchaeota archaeon]